MTRPPLVSILIPAYNAEQWISDAIQSALNQTWRNVEIIVIDDGSTDATHAVARGFQNSRTLVLSQPNQGASATRNHALRLAQGQYIQWLDADDSLDIDKLELQLAHRDCSSDTLLSSSWGQYYYRPHRTVFRENELCKDRYPADWLQTKMETNSWMAIESWLVPREIAEKAGPWNTTLSADDDGEYFSRNICASERIVFVREARSRCRLANPNSISKAPKTHRWLKSQLNAMAMQIDQLLSLEPSKRSRSACLSLLRRWYGHFYPEHPDLMLEARSLSLKLGGDLKIPELRGHYRWIESILGRRLTKRTQTILPHLKSRSICAWDRFLHTLGV